MFHRPRQSETDNISGSLNRPTQVGVAGRRHYCSEWRRRPRQGKTRGVVTDKDVSENSPPKQSYRLSL
ncbi:hypothetical protein GDO81_021911 [Engystomops pustulosus]|uniref:Uncharacterized protein n=1 Tax=Engystomops pustulosus TaxID=76066 RepID=A0AAV6ZY83_ENGPU|nr:hypothetical protein GDO81_021911 [Engystomops pustulosus]